VVRAALDWFKLSGNGVFLIPFCELVCLLIKRPCLMRIKIIVRLRECVLLLYPCIVRLNI
jgi:hypothetical protein